MKLKKTIFGKSSQYVVLKSDLEIACLTEEVRVSSVKYALFVSMFVTFIISIAYFLYGVVGEYSSFDFFAIVTIVMSLYSIYVIFLFRGNLIITFRYLILFIPIIVTSYVWWKYKGEVYTHYMGFDYQTVKATYMVVFGGILSAIGAATGWIFGIYKFRSYGYTASRKQYYALKYIKKHSNKLIYIGTFGALLFGYLYLLKSGGTLFSKGSYTGHGQGLKIDFAVFNIFQMFFMALALIGITLQKTKYRLTFLFLIISYIFGILAGSRADYLLPILLLLLILLDGNVLNANYKPMFIILINRYSRVALITFFGFIISSSFALFRNNLDMNLLSIFIEYFEDISQIFIVTMRGHEVFWMETANHAIGGFYGFVQKIDLGYMNYLYGLDYLYFIPRALPGSIRPESLDALNLAWHTGINGEVMTQGGVYESAEAYANFGFIGCFFISFFISFFYAWLLKKAKKDGSVFFMAWYLVNGFMVSRIIWYQNFILVRIATVILIFYILYYIYRKVLFFTPNSLSKKHAL